MKRYKRRIIESDSSDEDEDFIKQRRSSLQVNLSYTADSGHESTWRTEIENTGRVDKIQTSRRLSRNKTARVGTACQSKLDSENLQSKTDVNKYVINNSNSTINDETKKEIQLKQLTINLEDISRTAPERTACQSKLDNGNLQSKADKNKYVIDNSNSTINDETKKEVQLKHHTINLEDISTKEHTLDLNCKRLKDMILSKTKEIFDKSNELSIKTTVVLTGRENSIANDLCDLDINKKSVIVLNTTNDDFKSKISTECEHVNDNQSENYSYNVTPTLSNEQKIVKKSIDKTKLAPKQLFTTNKDVENKQNCRIIEDIILKKNIPVSSVREINPVSPILGSSILNSPILSGSNKRLIDLRRRKSRLYTQSQFDDHDNTLSIIHSDYTTNIGLPILSSTLIENNIMDKEPDKTVRNERENDISTSRTTHTENNVVSMEITEVHGGIRSSKRHLSLQNSHVNIDNCFKNNKEENSERGNLKRSKNITVQKLENANNSVNKIIVHNTAYSDLLPAGVEKDQGIINVSADIHIFKNKETTEEVPLITRACNVHERNNSTEEQNTSFSDDGESETIRSSLNVNTSLDIATANKQMRNVHKSISKDSKMITSNQNSGIGTNNKKLIVSKDQESINTIRTSLQMNTSVDSVYKTSKRENIHKQSVAQDKNDDMTKYLGIKEINYVSSLDTDLTNRLRNISSQNQVHCNESKISKVRDTGDIEKIDSHNLIKNQYRKSDQSSRDSVGYVETTPYPISRSVLLRSHLRNKTRNLDTISSLTNNLKDIDDKDNNGETKSSLSAHLKTASNDIFTSNKTSNENVSKNGTIIEETSNCNSILSREKSIVIQDTLEQAAMQINETTTIASQNTQSTPVKKKKKRLLPLKEDSDLCSISPLDNDCTYEKSIRTKPIRAKGKKKLKKKFSKQNPTSSKHDTSKILRNIANEESSSNDSYVTFKNKEKEKKKPKKPRKVISKKIVIKKFVNRSILDVSGQNKKSQLVQSRHSTNDFVTNQIIATQRNRYRSQKIVIVATGLCKGDKNLVRNIVKSLGMAEMELNVSKRTTHVVSTGVRTVNLLRGIIRGCWLITLEWVLKSLENEMWLDPEKFEMKHFSKAVLENRKDRLLFGPSYISELFATCGFIFVEHKTTMPRDTLKELIKTAGGHITENPKLAKIVIGSNGLKETWIIDSITTNEVQLTKHYQTN